MGSWDRRTLILMILAGMILLSAAVTRGDVEDPSGSSDDIFLFNTESDADHRLPPNHLDFRLELGGEVSSMEWGPDGNIYATCRNDYLRCVEPSGSEKWKLWDASILGFLSMGDPIVIIDDYHIARIDPDDGRIIWEYEDTIHLEDHLIFEDRIICMVYSDIIHCIDENGIKLWTLEHYGGNYDTLTDWGGVHHKYAARNKMERFHEPTPDGKILYSSIQDYYYDERESNITALDINGNILFNVTIPASGTEIHQKDNGNMILLGGKGWGLTSKVMEVDPGGSIVWEVDHDGSDNIFYLESRDEVFIFPDFDYYEEEVEYDNEVDVVNSSGVVSTRSIPLDTGLYIADYSSMLDLFIIEEFNETYDLRYTFMDPDFDRIFNISEYQSVMSGIITGPDGGLYFANDKRELVRMDRTGNVTFNVSMPFKMGYHKTYESTLQGFEILSDDQNNLYIGTTRLMKVSKEGDILWDIMIGGMLCSTPIIDEDGTIFITSNEAKLYSISDEGAINWETDIPDISNDDLLMSNDRERIIVTLGYRGLACYDKNGYLRWNTSLNGSVWHPPVVLKNGNLVFHSNLRWLYSCDIDGNEIWKVYLNDWGIGSPVETGSGDIILITRSTFFKLSPEGEILIEEDISGLEIESNFVINENDEVIMGGELLYGFNSDCKMIWSTAHPNNHRMDQLQLGPDGSIIGHSSYSMSFYKADGGYEWLDSSHTRSARSFIDDQRVIYTSSNGVTAYSYEGRPLWSYVLPGIYISEPNYFHPSVSGDRVVFSSGSLYSISWDEDSAGIKPQAPKRIGYGYPESVHLVFNCTETGYPVQGYRIYRAVEDGDFEYYLDIDAAGNSARLEHGFDWRKIEHYYAVAYNQYEESEPSVITNTTKSYWQEPSPPRNFKRKEIEGDLHLTWDPPRILGHEPLLGYKILGSVSGEHWDEIAYLPPDQLSYEVENYRSDGYEQYRVAADNEWGWTMSEDEVEDKSSNKIPGTMVSILIEITVVIIVTIIFGIVVIRYRKQSLNAGDNDKDQK